MEKWLILFSILQKLLKPTIKNPRKIWVKIVGFLLASLMTMAGVLFAIWSLYDYLKGNHLDAIASIQMSGILFGIVAGGILILFVIKKIITKCAHINQPSAIDEVLDISSLLYQDAAKMKYVLISLFKKNPLIASGTTIVAVCCLLALFKKDAQRKQKGNLETKTK